MESKEEAKLQGQDKDCPICYTIMVEPISLSKCQHRVCAQCLSHLSEIVNKCPLCRSGFDVPGQNQWEEQLDIKFQEYLKNTFGQEYQKRYKELESAFLLIKDCEYVMIDLEVGNHYWPIKEPEINSWSKHVVAHKWSAFVRLAK